jgi:hypothetical protein
MRNKFRILVEKLDGKRQLGVLLVNGRIILKWSVRKYGPVAGSCENDNECLIFIILGETS